LPLLRSLLSPCTLPFKGADQQVLVLFYTPACHLCEQAEALLQDAFAEIPFQLEKVDIVLDNALLERYGSLIPVLKKGVIGLTGDELCWPFDDKQLAAFLFNQSISKTAS
jgi:thiol-disulfide isomerase/thioredoxin